MMFVYSLFQSFISWSVRYSNRKCIELRTKLFIQDYLWSLSIHSYSSLFSWPVEYLNRKSDEYMTNYITQHYLWSLSIYYTVRYSVGQFVI